MQEVIIVHEQLPDVYEHMANLRKLAQIFVSQQDDTELQPQGH